MATWIAPSLVVRANHNVADKSEQLGISAHARTLQRLVSVATQLGRDIRPFHTAWSA